MSQQDLYDANFGFCLCDVGKYAFDEYKWEVEDQKKYEMPGIAEENNGTKKALNRSNLNERIECEEV